MTNFIPYVLVVRWPVGGIRTHLKYAKTLGGSPAERLRPKLCALDDADTRTLLENLAIDPERDRTRGVRGLLQLAFAVLKTCLNPAIHVVHSQGFISALLAYPAVCITRKRHVITVHDVVTDAVLASKGRLGLTCLGWVLRHAYAVHAVGRDCAMSLRRLPGVARASNVITVPNGINSRQFTNPLPHDWHAKLGVPLNTRIIGFFGRFMEQKGFLDLVRACEALKAQPPSHSFRIVAVGEGDWLREYRDLVNGAGLEQLILFQPRAENPASLMAGCQMIVMPSRWEAYPLQAPEVLSLGIPLLASDCIGLSEVTQGTPARIFPAGDPAALADAMRAEIDAPTTRLAQDYAPAARARFDFAPNATRLARLIEWAHRGAPLEEFS